MRKKIAVILSRFPFPLNKGDKLRAFHQLKYLSRFHEIHLHCLHTEPLSKEYLDAVKPFCAEINLHRLSVYDIGKGLLFSLAHKYPVQVGYFYSARIKKKIREQIAAKGIETVYCQLSRTALYAKDLPVHKVVDFQDSFSINYKRLSESSAGIYKMFYTREYHTMLDFEQKMLAWFDASAIISGFDKSQITDRQNKMTVVPNGVDNSYFSAGKEVKEYDILFVGNLSYQPNKNAVSYLVSRIFPLLQNQLPEIKINIAGADTPEEISKLASSHITISGFIPDIREAYRSAKIFVAPLFTGAGMQNKILEAMSMKLPCVTTSVVNSSLNATEGKHLLIANNEQQFADHIVSLLSNESLRETIGAQAGTFVTAEYSWDKANEKLNSLL